MVSTMRDGVSVAWGLRTAESALKTLEVAARCQLKLQQISTGDLSCEYQIEDSKDRFSIDFHGLDDRFSVAFEIHDDGIVRAGSIGMLCATPAQSQAIRRPPTTRGLADILIPIIRLAKRYQSRLPSALPIDFGRHRAAVENMVYACHAQGISPDAVILGRLADGGAEVTALSRNAEHSATPDFKAFIDRLIVHSMELEAKRFDSFDTRDTPGDASAAHVAIELQLHETLYCEDVEADPLETMRWIASPPVAGPWFKTVSQ